MAGLDVTLGGSGTSKVTLGVTHGCSSTLGMVGGNATTLGMRKGAGTTLGMVGGCKVTIGISFVPAADPYLRVRPEEMLWISVGNDIAYDVYSNLNCNVT